MAIINGLVSATAASASYIQFNSGIALASGSATPNLTNLVAGVATTTLLVESIVQDGKLVPNPHLQNPGVYSAGTPREGTVTTSMDSNG